jgi:hypothetical protein
MTLIGLNKLFILHSNEGQFTSRSIFGRRLNQTTPHSMVKVRRNNTSCTCLPRLQIWTFSEIYSPPKAQSASLGRRSLWKKNMNQMNVMKQWSSNHTQVTQCTYNVTSRHVHVTNVAVEKQEALHIISLHLQHLKSYVEWFTDRVHFIN